MDKWHDFIDFLRLNPYETNYPNKYDDELTNKLFDFYEECRQNFKKDKKNYYRP